MRSCRFFPFILPAVVLAACGDQQPSTEPTSPETGRPTYDHAPGHFVVNSAADPGDGRCTARQCTLREAINTAGSTQITFAPGLSGPINLAPPASGGGALVINKPLRITGPSGGIIIRRRSIDPEFGILRIDASGEVTLSNLIIRNGSVGISNAGILSLATSTVERNGDGILNGGRLTLTRSTVADNRVRGIVNAGDRLTLVSTTVSGNTSTGLVNLRGRSDLTNSTVAENLAGGISQDRGIVTLSHVRVVDNSTTAEGGGIFLFGGVMTIRNSNITRNSATRGGGIANQREADLTISGTTIWNNSASVSGGGIFNEDNRRGGPRVRLTNSTISGNTAQFGGGIFNSGFLGTSTVVLTNSTVTLNSASEQGGGILQASDAAVAALINTIVAANSAPEGPDLSVNPCCTVSSRFSLIGDGTGTGITNADGNQVGTSSSPIDPKLGPLANNGGLTRTHALLAGSPAIDAASNDDCPARDQRGVLRPQGAGCDMGSYEKE